MLFWLRPRYVFFISSHKCLANNFSRQIRPPIYSLKQSKLRRRRVIRYAILYFTMFVLFIALLIGPIFAQSHISVISLFKEDPSKTFYLFKPWGLNNNNTNGTDVTGTGLNSAAAAATTTGSGGNAKRMFMEYAF